MTISAITCLPDRNGLLLEDDCGHCWTLAARHLRLACRCAECSALQRRGGTLSCPEELSLTGLNPVGGYALNLHFSDGHQRGIYPYPYLQSLCLPAD